MENLQKTTSQEWRTINEVRATLGLPPVDGADEISAPLLMASKAMLNFGASLQEAADALTQIGVAAHNMAVSLRPKRTWLDDGSIPEDFDE